MDRWEIALGEEKILRERIARDAKSCIKEYINCRVKYFLNIWS